MEARYNSPRELQLRLTESKMKRAFANPVFRAMIIATLTLAACLIYAQKPRSNPAAAPSTPQDAKKSGVGHSASLQTFLNLGKAYYEQGKYAQAVEQFQKKW